MQDFITRFNGEPYVTLFVPQSELEIDGDECLGATFPERNEIKISKDISGPLLLETFVHEGLHAIFPWIEESKIEQGARELSAGLGKAFRIMKKEG